MPPPYWTQVSSFHAVSSFWGSLGPFLGYIPMTPPAQILGLFSLYSDAVPKYILYPPSSQKLPNYLCCSPHLSLGVPHRVKLPGPSAAWNILTESCETNHMDIQTQGAAHKIKEIAASR